MTVPPSAISIHFGFNLNPISNPIFFQLPLSPFLVGKRRGGEEILDEIFWGEGTCGWRRGRMELTNAEWMDFGSVCPAKWFFLWQMEEIGRRINNNYGIDKCFLFYLLK
jgi:hypothetical protein